MLLNLRHRRQQEHEMAEPKNQDYYLPNLQYVMVKYGLLYFDF